MHGDIEHAIAGFARVPNSGLVVTASAAAATETRRELITTLAARHKLPVIANNKTFVTGGLMSSGADFVEQFRRAADYVDRILKGAKPADLPVRAPNKYELAINLKTAKSRALPSSDRARRSKLAALQLSRVREIGALT